MEGVRSTDLSLRIWLEEDSFDGVHGVSCLYKNSGRVHLVATPSWLDIKTVIPSIGLVLNVNLRSGMVGLSRATSKAYGQPVT